MPTVLFKIILWLFFLFTGGAGLWFASEISGISFDPIGSKAVPCGIAGILLMLLFIDLFHHGLRQKNDDQPASFFNLLSVGIVLIVSLLYCIMLFNLRLPFSIATVIFMPLISIIIQRKCNLKIISACALSGIFLGFGGEALFTKILFIDLPSLW